MNIGTLTGAIEIEDQLSSRLNIIGQHVEEFAKDFVDRFGVIGVGVGIVVTAVTAMTAAITSLAVKGSAVNEVSDTLEHFAQKAGGAEVVLEQLRTGVRSTVDDMSLMRDATKVLSVGAKLTADDFKLMGDAAFAMKNRGLGPTSDMLDTISQALVTGRTRTLSMRLGVIDAGDAEQIYANKIGLAKSELSQTQIAEAKRIAVLDLLRNVVTGAANDHVNFADKVQQARAKFTNWMNDLASAVARSPEVTKAFDDILGAVMSIGNSKDTIQAIVGAINLFADGVSLAAPVVKILATGVHDAVTFAVDYKEVTITLITLLGVYKVAQMASATAVGEETAATVMNTGAKITNTAARVAEQKVVTSSSEELILYSLAQRRSVSTATELAGAEAAAARARASNIASMGTLRAAFQAGAEKMGLMNSVVFEGVAATATLTGVIATSVVGVAAAAAVVVAGYQAWKLWSENAERAAAAERQATVDGKNLATLNQVMETTFTDINTASKEWIRRNQEAKPAVDAHAAALEKMKAISDAFDKSVQSVVDSVVKEQRELNTSRVAYQQLGDRVLLTRDAQKSFTDAMDKIVESGRTLTTEEDRRYKMIVDHQIIDEHLNETKLKTKGITLELIDANKALGVTNQQLAEAWGVSADSIQKYYDGLQKTRDLTRDLAKIDPSTSDLRKKKQANQDEFEDQLRKLDTKSDQYMTQFDLLMKTRSAKDQADTQGLGDNWLSRYQDTQKALQDLMDAQSNPAFNRGDLDALQEKYWGLRDAIHDGNKELSHTKDAAAAAKMATSDYLGKTISDLETAIKAASELNEKIVMSQTYDLSTKEGIARYRAANPGRPLQYSDQEIMDFTKSGGTLEQLLSSGIDRTKITASTPSTASTAGRSTAPTVVAPTIGHTVNVAIQATGVIDPRTQAEWGTAIKHEVMKGLSTARPVFR